MTFYLLINTILGHSSVPASYVPLGQKHDASTNILLARHTVHTSRVEQTEQ
jgi:hypothetical protein